MKELSRREKILAYLKKYGTITSWEAIKNFGETRLSARIYEFKKEGYVFKTEKIRVPTRDGWTYVAQYTLIRG